MKLALAFLTLISLAAPARAQMRDNRDKELNCNEVNRYRDSRDRPRVCEMTENTIAASGRLEIEPGHNGSVIVKGWSQNSVLVRARLEAWADNDSEAKTLASQVHMDAVGGRIRATGPDRNQSWFNWNDERRWTVSFEVFTPYNTDLKTESHNGGLTITDLRGRIEVETHNGGVRLTRVGGDIVGRSHNGGIQVELEGTPWDGRQIDVSTHNGGITFAAPASFSARVETRTHRGRVDSDFPINVRGRIDDENLNFTIGSGGPLVRVETHNGGIRLRRM